MRKVREEIGLENVQADRAVLPTVEEGRRVIVDGSLNSYRDT